MPATQDICAGPLAIASDEIINSANTVALPADFDNHTLVFTDDKVSEAAIDMLEMMLDHRRKNA